MKLELYENSKRYFVPYKISRILNNLILVNILKQSYQFYIRKRVQFTCLTFIFFRKLDNRATFVDFLSISRTIPFYDRRFGLRIVRFGG